MKTERLYVVHTIDEKSNIDWFEVDLEGKIETDILLVANAIISISKEYERDVNLLCVLINYAAAKMIDHINDIKRTEYVSEN